MKNIVFFTGVLVTFLYLLYSFFNTSTDLLPKKISIVKLEKNIKTLHVPRNDNNSTLDTISINENNKDVEPPFPDKVKEEPIEDRDDISPDEIIEKENELSDDYKKKKQITQIEKIKNISLNTLLSTAQNTHIKIKAKEKDGLVKVKFMISNQMLCYIEEKEAGIKTNFITHIYGFVDDKTILDASISQNLSENPLIIFSFYGGKKGQTLNIVYQLLDGSTHYASKKIK